VTAGNAQDALAVIEKTIQELSQYGGRGAETIKVLMALQAELGIRKQTCAKTRICGRCDGTDVGQI